LFSVIPANTGIQRSQILKISWTPVFTEVTSSHEAVTFFLIYFRKLAKRVDIEIGAAFIQK